MAFKRAVQRKILLDREDRQPLPCVMCGRVFPLPEAAHIIDGKEWREKAGAESQVNGIPLCPSCHKVFDEILRPYLFRALEKFGASGLPKCWAKNNKISEVTDKHFPVS